MFYIYYIDLHFMLYEYISVDPRRAAIVAVSLPIWDRFSNVPPQPPPTTGRSKDEQSTHSANY